MNNKSHDRKRLIKLALPFVIMFGVFTIVLRERIGLRLVDLNSTADIEYAARLNYVSDDDFSPVFEQEAECLIISDSRDEQSVVLLNDMEKVLSDMRVGYVVCDINKSSFPDIEKYHRIVITLSDLSKIKNNILRLCDWVEKGGNLMNTGTFLPDSNFAILAAKAGVINADNMEFTKVNGMKITEGFMINAANQEFNYDEPSLTALNIALLSDCRVLIKDTKANIPILWERDFGNGRYVMMNQVLTGKINRGILCAAYSLLGNIGIYPVINASGFYIDDFPSPVPSGEGKYITEQYGLSISSFYSQVWWPDMLKLEKKYGIRHTGLIIEEYSDQIEGDFKRNSSIERFTFYGNMLLNNGGELGFHGYNHMPLCLENYDYEGKYDSYNKWENTDDMSNALTELYLFSKHIFPMEQFRVYVPPSNILSIEGRSTLINILPDIRIIASTYFSGNAAFTQEFEVADDGIIETPRITSGCIIDDFMRLAAFSELNFHFVQSHFLHPDDVLDEDRGAAIGWEKMFSNLSDYVEYIYTAAPGIRNVTGSGMGEAVREYCKLSVSRNEEENRITLMLGGFYKEAYLLVRANKGIPSCVEGGELEHITGDLYLLFATNDNVVIEY